MSNTFTAIDHLYAFEDGDVLTPAMGVSWVKPEDVGYGLQQYWNPTINAVIETDFKQHPVLLFPQPYSSKMGNIVVPETEGQQWYYGNISDEGGILQNGKVKEKFVELFEVTTIELNKRCSLLSKSRVISPRLLTIRTSIYITSLLGRASSSHVSSSSRLWRLLASHTRST